MPVNYYTDTILQNLPFQINQIVRVILYHIASDLYKKDMPKTEAEMLSRFVITASTGEMGSRENIDKFKNPNWKFPFTVYTPGDIELDKTKIAGLPTFYNYYSETLGDYVSAKPYIFHMNMVSFFTTQSDYYTAYKILLDDLYMLNKFYVPFVFEGKTLTFPVEFNIDEVVKGEYAQEFSDWLAKGKILDVVHACNVEYFDFVGNNALGSGVVFGRNSKVVYPVDDIVLYFNSYNEDINNSYNIATVHSLAPLAITSTYPADGATNIPSSGVITLNFNTQIQEQTAIDAFSIFPYVDGQFSFDCSGLVMNYTPYVGLASGTVYGCTIDHMTLLDIYDSSLNTDYTFNFTTR